MEYVSGNIFIRTQALMKLGQSVESHAHNFDHTTYVAKGAFRIEQLNPTHWVDGVPTAFAVVRTVEKRAIEMHNWVLVKAGIQHRLTALMDDSLYHCIYSHRIPSGEIVEEYDGWMGGYE